LGTESSSRKTVSAGVVDDDVDRDPETQGSINERILEIAKTTKTVRKCRLRAS